MENFKIQVLIIFVAISYQIEEAASKNTFQCPTSCLCISGDAGDDQVGNILEEKVISDAWNRFQRATTVQSTVIYLCRNAELHRVQQEMMSNANALFLDGNNIHSLDTIDQVDNGTLNHASLPTMMLSLSNNKIKNITVSFLLRLPYLKLIILRNNLLDNLHWTKGQQSVFPDLLELDMSKNTLATLTPEDTGVFPSLIRLDLSGNEINFVDGRAFLKFPRLEYLDLSSNQISERSFYNDHTLFPSIKVLSLSNNAIDSIKKDELVKFFRALPSLTSLDLSSNSIASKAISFEAFSAFQDLRKLNLSSCNIKYFAEGWLNGGPNATLKILDISRNRLTSVSANYLSAWDQNNPSRGDNYHMDKAEYRHRQNQAFRSLLAIEVLYLNDNYLLSEIEDEAFEYVPNIQLLFLQNCNIHRFTFATLESRLLPISSSLPAMTSIWIFGNPIICDCYLRPLISWSNLNFQIRVNQTYIKHEIDPAFYTIEPEEDDVTVEIGFAVCSSPEKYSGMAVEAVPIESMTCVDDTYSIVIAMLIGPLSFAGAVILVILCGSLHVLATKMRHNAMTVYYPKPEPPRNTNKQQKWHDPPAHCHTRSAWYGNTTSANIGQHGGMYTNLVMGQIASRARHSETAIEGISSPTSRVAHEPTHRQPKTKSTPFADDASSRRRESDDTADVVSKDIPYIDHGSDIETKSRDARQRFSTTDYSSNAPKAHIDSRTDESQL